MKLGYSLIFLITFGASMLGMANPYLVSHAFGQVSINNFSGYPIQVTFKRILDYDTTYKNQPIIIPNGQSQKFESVRILPGVISNIASLKENVQSKNDIYQMSVSYYGTYFTPTEYELVPSLQKEADSCKGKGGITVSVKTITSYFGSSLDFSYNCGKEPSLQQDWQMLDDEKIKPTPGASSLSPFIFEDIMRLHPGWGPAEAKAMFEAIVRTEAATKQQFNLEEKSFMDNPATQNSISQKFGQLVELAKREVFLKSDATIGRIPSEGGTAKIVASDSAKSKVAYTDGYVHFLSPLYTRAPETGDFIQHYDQLASVSKEQAKEVAKKIVGIYKIHLMPTYSWNELVTITSRFLNDLMHDAELQKLIGGFKVRIAPIIQGPNIMPLFVIYIFQGTQVAQIVLNKVVALFNGIHGLGLPPRYNGSVNDLIFVAQGNGQEKETYSKYFEEPRKIYFKATFPSLSPQNYHLKNPLNGTEIVQ